MVYSEFVSDRTFVSPKFLSNSAWLEHGPFAGWLVEALRPKVFVELGTHGGFSYFAFCQAIKELGLATKCHAVDTWAGDEHAGFYSEEIFSKVSAYNDKEYAAFSTLLRMKFSDALANFQDKSVDLLHIDGRHFYEDVKEDFLTWAPKLTENAIVLFHDTNVFSSGFGVWKLFEELGRQYPIFEFKHGYGLGVLAIGEIPDALQPLFVATGEQANSIRHIYSQLGAVVFKQQTLCREVEDFRQRYVPAQLAINSSNSTLPDFELGECEGGHILSSAVSNNPASGQATLRTLPTRVARRVKIGLLSVDKFDMACSTLRIRDPLALLGEYVEVVRLARADNISLSFVSLREELIDSCDLFLMQRAFPCQEASAFLEKIYESGKPIIYETDDLMDEIPPEHYMYGQTRPRFPFIRTAIRKASALVVSTESLQNHYLALNRDVSHFPNYLCEERWRIERKAPAVDGVVTIGFAGGATHSQDIKMVENAILKAAHYFGDRIRFVFWGAISDGLRTLPNCAWVNGDVNYFQYPRRLAELGIDVGLIPLEDTFFNRNKSNLKWLEYSMLGIVSICSAVEPYAEAKKEGLALAVPNDETAWFEAIVRLVEDDGLRQRIAAAAKAHVERHYTLERHIGRYAAFLNRFIPEGLRLPEQLELRALPSENEDDCHIFQDEYEAWRDRHRLQEVDAEVLAERMMRWPSRPTLAVVTVVKDGELASLAGTIDSLQRQLYPRWKLIVVSDQACPDPVFENTDILGWLQIDDTADDALTARAVSELLPVIGADVFCLVPPGTEFEPQTFVLTLDYFQRHPEWTLAYTDHDSLDQDGNRRRPAFKPDFNLDLLRSSAYIGDAVFFRGDAVIAAGGIQPYPLAETFDLVLRLLEIHGEKAVGHIADALVSLPLRQPDAHLLEASRLVALETHLARQGIAAEVGHGLLPGTLRVEYRHAGTPLVSIIIPNRDKIEVLQPCLESLFEKTRYPNFEVIVVDNQSEDPDVHVLYADLSATHGDRFRVEPYDAPFNFSAQINLGARSCRGELLLLLNNDCEIIQPEWLDRMVHHARRPEVGAVGAMLLYPESSQIQHAGIMLGMPADLKSVADHPFVGKNPSDAGYLGRLQVDQNYSALTAACLLVRREVFEQLGGFDTEKFVILYNDVDFCLRLAEAGYKNVWTPYARMVHRHGHSLKSLSEDPAKSLQALVLQEQELRNMMRRWLPVIANDPAGNRHLSLKGVDLHLETSFPLGWNPDIHERNRVLGFSVSGGSGEYRIIKPLRALARAGFMHTEVVNTLPGNKMQKISVAEMARQSPDTILIHAATNPFMQEAVPLWKEFIPKLRVVYGVDDRMDSIPEKSSFFFSHKRNLSDMRMRMRKMLKHCDAAVVSTEPLVGMLRGMADDIRVIPNALEREVWGALRPQRQAGRKPRVGWVGAQQHRGDLELIREVVKATADDVEWVFMGMWLPEFSQFVQERHSWIAFSKYPEKMASLNLDLAIAPLEINEFNEAKSNLRLLEYGILGFPVICTDIFPYRTQNAPVTCLPNDPQRWIEAIQDKVRDLDQLACEGDALRAWVLKNFMMEQHVDAWYDILTPKHA